MEIKITSAMVGAIIALLLVLLFTNFKNSMRIEEIEARHQNIESDISAIKEILSNPEVTSFE